MRPVPAPAIIDGVEWEVRDSGDPRTAFVDFDAMAMVVPMDGTPAGDMIRAHETSHVAITPRDLERLKKLAKEFPNRTLQAVEDCRVYCSLALAGIPAPGHWSNDVVKKFAENWANKDTPEGNEEKTRVLLALKGTDDYPKLCKVLPEKNVEDAERLYEKHFAPSMSKSKLPSFEDTVAMARELHELYGAEYDPKEEEHNVEDKVGSRGKGESPEERENKRLRELWPGRPLDEKDARDYKPAPKLTEEFLSEEEKKEITDTLGRSHMRGEGIRVEDENVKMVTPKLTVLHKSRGKFGNRKTNSDTGSIPRRLSRYAVDSAVFSRNVKKGFGSVLIDVSSSMSLSTKAIDEIIEALPNTTIAAYSGDYDGSGHITVLAKEGKRVAEIPRFPGGNMVDLQGLEWLSRQRAPRAWICDGVVTGQSDEPLNISNLLKVVRICKLNNIKRYRDIGKLIDGIKERKAHGYGA